MKMLSSSPYLTALPFAIAIAVVAAVIVAVFIVRSYSMKHKPVDYPLDQFTKLDLREQSDTFTGSTVTSREINSGRDRK